MYSFFAPFFLGFFSVYVTWVDSCSPVAFTLPTNVNFLKGMIAMTKPGLYVRTSGRGRVPPLVSISYEKARSRYVSRYSGGGGAFFFLVMGNHHQTVLEEEEGLRWSWTSQTPLAIDSRLASRWRR